MLWTSEIPASLRITCCLRKCRFVSGNVHDVGEPHPGESITRTDTMRAENHWTREVSASGLDPLHMCKWAADKNLGSREPPFE